MPELPEVEIVVRALNKSIINSQIKKVDVFYDGILKNTVPGFLKNVLEAKIKQVQRLGKAIAIELSNDNFIIIHLKMTGQLVLNQKEKHKHTHLIFSFNNGSKLYYNDVRKFGYIWAATKAEKKDFFANKFKLGPDPFSKDFEISKFAEKINKSTRSIKQILLDQKVIAGLGNIYVDESLFASSIHPQRKGVDLNFAEIKKLCREIVKVLKKSLTLGGSSSRNYVHLSGDQGNFQNHFKVYRQTGEPCIRCQSPIQRTIVGGRGTHYCPKCQVC